MANKTANVLARVEPETKREAEAVMQKLGISASTVINLLYNQIILTKSIPFPLTLPREPKARDEMTDEEFSAMLQKSMDDVQAERTRPAKEVFADLRRELSWMESYAVEMTRQAGEQLSEIVQYISVTLDSPQAAMNTLDALEEEIDSLSAMPSRYPAIEDDPAGDRGIRKTRAKNFNIYYQVDNTQKRVNILAVCYARRDRKQVIDALKSSR